MLEVAIERLLKGEKAPRFKHSTTRICTTVAVAYFGWRLFLCSTKRNRTHGKPDDHRGDGRV